MNSDEMKSLHDGFVQKRKWHKVRWIGGKYSGKYDIFDDDDIAKNKDSVEIIETFMTDLCAAGVSMEFGRTSKEKIDEWIRQNRQS